MFVPLLSNACQWLLGVVAVVMVMEGGMVEGVELDKRLLKWKCRKQKLEWYDLGKCHKAKVHDAEKNYFRKMCDGHKYLSDKSSGLRPRAAEDVVNKTRRKEYRCMTPRERWFFHRSLRTLKTTMVEDYSEWDNFVIRHDFENSPAAHYGPAFLGWHRHFLLSMEQAIKKHYPESSLPYWDNRMEKRLDLNHRGSALFSKYLLGSNSGEVRDGVAGNWTTVGQACQNISPTLKRSVEASNAYLFSDYDVDTILARSLKEISAPWNSYFEDIHGSIHMYFGADSAMGPVNCSPNDPIFYLHHCFIDKLFETFRQKMKNEGRSYDYPDTSAPNLPKWFVDDFDVEKSHAGNASMLPFEGLTNADGYTSDDYTGIYYEYQDSPADVTGCRQDDDCCHGDKSYFLWCDTRSGKCIAKVKEDEGMDSSYPNNACLCPWKATPVNQDGVCTCTLS